MLKSSRSPKELEFGARGAGGTSHQTGIRAGEVGHVQTLVIAEI